jgi:hypothetical protein
MIRSLHRGLNIPAEILAQETHVPYEKRKNARKGRGSVAA